MTLEELNDEFLRLTETRRELEAQLMKINYEIRENSQKYVELCDKLVSRGDAPGLVGLTAGASLGEINK